MGDAWDLSQGGRRDVCLAVVDTGVAYDSYDFLETNFVPGYDFWNNDSDPLRRQRPRFHDRWHHGPIHQQRLRARAA